MLRHLTATFPYLSVCISRMPTLAILCPTQFVSCFELSCISPPLVSVSRPTQPPLPPQHQTKCQSQKDQEDQRSSLNLDMISVCPSACLHVRTWTNNESKQKPKLRKRSQLEFTTKEQWQNNAEHLLRGSLKLITRRRCFQNMTISSTSACLSVWPFVIELQECS